jgi:1-acyl-sn-glycerol-3-phosphate acyltransferase
VIYWLSFYILKFIAVVYFRGRAQGRENLPKRGPYIGVLNHNSFVDVVAMTLVLKSRATAMVKHSLFQIPILKWWLHAVGLFPVVRDAGDDEAFQKALAVLKQGGIFFIAAEGTRLHDGKSSRARTGFVRLAQMTQCPVVPVALYGTREAMPPGAMFPRPVRIAAMVGQPMVLPPVDCIPENKPLLQEQADMVMRKVYELVTIMKKREKESIYEHSL